MTPELQAQVQKEAQQIAQAPIVVNTTIVGRCHFCGQLAASGTWIYGPTAIDGARVGQFKGVCCGG